MLCCRLRILNWEKIDTNKGTLEQCVDFEIWEMCAVAGLVLMLCLICVTQVTATEPTDDCNCAFQVFQFALFHQFAELCSAQ